MSTLQERNPSGLFGYWWELVRYGGMWRAPFAALYVSIELRRFERALERQKQLWP